MTSTPRTTAPLTAAIDALTRVAAAIPTDQPARLEISNYARENVIRVQLVVCPDPQIGADIAILLGLPANPVSRPTSDKSTELTWAGDVDGWSVIMIALEYSTALNVP